MGKNVEIWAKKKTECHEFNIAYGRHPREPSRFFSDSEQTRRQKRKEFQWSPNRGSEQTSGIKRFARARKHIQWRQSENAWESANTISRNVFADFHHTASGRDKRVCARDALAFFICTYHSFGLLMNHKNDEFIDRKVEIKQKFLTCLWQRSPAAHTNNNSREEKKNVIREKDNIPIENFQHKFNVFDACAIICARFGLNSAYNFFSRSQYGK